MTEPKPNTCLFNGKYLVVNDEKIKEPLIYTTDKELKFKGYESSCINYWIILK